MGDKFEAAGLALGQRLARFRVVQAIVAVFDAVRGWTRPKPAPREHVEGYVRVPGLSGLRVSKEAVAKMGLEQTVALAVQDEDEDVQRRASAALARGKPS